MTVVTGEAMQQALHVIFGTGPVGCWTARALRARGQAVRAVNRSGARPALLPEDVPVVQADASDAAQAREAAAGAAVVYQAVNPPYHRWDAMFPPLQSGVLAAAREAGARYVSIENLYMYDASGPISEASRIAPVSRKGALRQRMAEAVMALHASGAIRAAALRSSDYYGPGVTQSALGERVFGPLVAGKTPQVLGSATLPHSFAYIEDVGVAAALLGMREAAMGEVWIAPHAPARTQGEMVAEAARVSGVPARTSVVSATMLRLAGLFVPAARASVEMLYEFTAPFVVDGSRFERAFEVSATPVATGIARTVAWYREQAG